MIKFNKVSSLEYVMCLCSLVFSLFECDMLNYDSILQSVNDLRGVLCFTEMIAVVLS